MDSTEDQISTETKLARQTLVLNRGFVAIQMTTVRHTMELLCQNRAKVVDDDYRTYDLSEWIDYSNVFIDLNRPDPTTYLATVGCNILLPKVITLVDFEVVPKRVMRFRRRDVFSRDGFTCQYCGNGFSPEQLTIDHVKPRSKGGTTCWENCVSSCKPCNTLKADRTPEEAKMKLLSFPKRPNANLHFNKKIENNPAWNKFT